MSMKIKLGKKEYDLSDIADVAQLQAELVPENWPGEKRECVKLFLQTLEELRFQLGRHLSANWQKITKAAQEQKEDGEPATVAVSFGFELDHSAPNVLAVPKIKMGFSVKHSTESKPVTRDLTQTDLFDADAGAQMTVILDAHGLEKEQEEAARKKKEEAEAAAKKKDEEAAAKAAAKANKTPKKKGGKAKTTGDDPVPPA